MLESVDCVLAGNARIILGFGVLLCFVVIKSIQAKKQRVNLPVVNWGGSWFPWLAALWNIRYARESIHTGYDRYKGFAFQISTWSRWEIYICSEQMIKEYRNLDSSKMSANAVTAELFQAKYCLPGAMENIHKIDVPILSMGITWQKMRAANKEDIYFSQFYEEFEFAFKSEMPIISGNESSNWTAVPCFQLAARIVSRLTAKSLVGRPLCRDQKLVDMFCNYGNIVPRDGFFLGALPNFIKPFVGPCLPSHRMSGQLQNIFLAEATKRRANGGQKTNWDLMDWLMNWVDETAPTEYNDTHVAVQISNIVFGAIHTTSQLLVHALYELAIRPSYIPPLRSEVSASLSKHSGWTKNAIESMHKLDSFVRESQRWNPLDAGSMARRVMKDLTFSNGLSIPAGNWIFAANSPVLRDEKHYLHAAQFDGFRFAKMRKYEGQGRGYSLVANGLSNMQFGDGKHACPGRYMAADEIRLILAYILVNYDIAMEGHKPRPKNVVLGKFIFPDLKAKIMLRKLY